MDTTGLLEIGEGCRLDAGAYSQHLDSDSTGAPRRQVGGILFSSFTISFTAGALGAGLGDDVGVAQLWGSDVILGATTLLDLDIASPSSFDRVLLDRALRLSDGPTLFAEFDSTGPIRHGLHRPPASAPSRRLSRPAHRGRRTALPRCHFMAAPEWRIP
ncbi:hypothetical protein OOT46_17640 [Aquabacterium sp. A7-Y]|uniref:hypothetical protein n=1 Tax=Aquabacterium sp. A7-Y TaxID=1349605 RepID=UPI00223DC7D7|nr:hypothetical protein [Aquabacterium sp. A7-Y]MCW7539665.1 hypothetical protein [Aquabacterium sp. A7-Y]